MTQAISTDRKSQISPRSGYSRITYVSRRGDRFRVGVVDCMTGRSYSARMTAPALLSPTRFSRELLVQAGFYPTNVAGCRAAEWREIVGDAMKAGR